MAQATKLSKRAAVDRLLDRYGRTYASEMSIHPERDTPAELYKLLVASLLMSARISSKIAMDATRALFDAGWTTPDKLAGSTWRERTDTLNRSGYARYDESTSRMLGESVELLQERWDGDLRKLREAADREPGEERRLLKEFTGIGDTGVDIFFREAQATWEELHPFADERALAAARRLGLGASADDLAELVDADDLPRLVAALVRVEHGDCYDELERDGDAG